MIASALAELATSASTQFAAQLATVAAKYGVTLVTPGSVQPWFDFETEQPRAALSTNASAIMSIRWANDAATQLARPSAGIRDTTLPVVVSYTYKDTSNAAVGTHVLYVPEAIALWLDSFPIASRVPGAGATITKIAPPLGKKIMVRQRKESVREAGGTTSFLWHAEAEFDIEIRDPSPGGVPVATLTVAPTSATIAAGQSLPLVATPRDADGNILLGRNIYFLIDDPMLARVDAVGNMTALTFGTANVLAACEGKWAGCALTLLHSVASIEVTPNPLALTTGNDSQLAIVLKDGDGNVVTGRVVTCRSSAPSFGTVTNTGLAHGVAAGGGTITITCESVSVTVPFTCTVSVVIPPFDTGNIAWAWDPDGIGAGQSLAGPSGTVATPAHTQGPPGFYTFGSADHIDFDDALDALWSSVGGFTIYAAVWPSAADLTHSDAPVVNKNSVSAFEFDLTISANQIKLYTYYGGAHTNYTTFPSNNGVLTAEAKAVVAVTLNPALARLSRAVIYANAVNVTNSAIATGSDGVITDTATLLRVGASSSGLTNPISRIAYVYAYAGVHDATMIANITNWLQTTKGWA